MMFDELAKSLEALGGIPEPFITPAENRENRKMVQTDWKLGPEKTGVKPSENKPYWNALAKAWQVDEKTARRRFCANCEYFDNTPARQAQMESIPLDQYDMDGGGRGYCTAFDFVCHNLRVCQAWEEKPFEED